MYTLYHMSGSCSNSVAIALSELGIEYNLQTLDLETKSFPDGTIIKDHNPSGYVPVLKTDKGYMTEVAVVLQYLADQKKELVPLLGTEERYSFMQTMHIISTEIHKSYFPIIYISKVIKEEPVKKTALEAFHKHLNHKYEYLEGILSSQEYIFGNDFTVADIYLFTVLNWSTYANFNDSAFLNCKKYISKIAQRPIIKQLKEDRSISF